MKLESIVLTISIKPDHIQDKRLFWLYHFYPASGTLEAALAGEGQ
jgi:hypothetical protein